MRRTHALVQVVEALLADPEARHWGYELSKKSGVRSGAMYPILQRLLDNGWLEDGWEDQAEITEKRPPRRYYLVTGEGERVMCDILQQAHADARFKRVRWGFA